MTNKILYCFIVFLFMITSCEKKKLLDLPEISFSYTNNTSTSPVNTSFNAISKNADKVEWNFGDGQTGIGSSIVHSYSTYGIFKVSATAISTDGHKSSSTEYVNISPYEYITISQVDISVPTPSYYNCWIYDSNGIELSETTFGTFGLSTSYTINPPDTIKDMANNFRITIGNPSYTTETCYFRPGDYIPSSGIFPSTFSTVNSAGHTITTHISWH